MMTKGVQAAWILALGSLLVSQAALAKPRNFEQEHVPEQLIVKFKAGTEEAQSMHKLALGGFKVLHTFGSNGAHLVESTHRVGEAKFLAAAEQLSSDPAIEYVEANTVIRINARFPNDARFGELYGLHNDGTGGGVAGASVHAPEAWDVTQGSRDVLVGVIDTGVDYTHPDIAPNYWTNPGESGTDAQGNDKRTNGIDDDGNGFVDDWRGWDFVNNDNDPIDDNDHGTHVSGTIGASGNDGQGVVGVNWQVSIVGLKFLSGEGSGSLADAVKAIEYGTKLGVTLTSNSWGGGGYSDTMEAAIRQAGEHGILFIAAAGNDGTNNDAKPHYPSSYNLDNVIAVAATDKSDGMANFSCFGPSSVDVAAPGVDILSSIKGGGYGKYSGTSMATPHVAGVAALIKAAYPDATAAQIKARILNTVDPVPALTGKVLTSGRVNAFNALETDTVAPNAADGLAVEATGLTSVTLGWNAAGDDGAVGEARRYEVRYAAQPIETDADWAAATKAQAEVSAARGGRVMGVIRGLAFNQTGYAAVQAIDNVGNVGPVSASVPFAVKHVVKVMENTADSLDGATVQAPWGLEAVSGRGTVFSDSPGGSYAANADVTLVLPAVALESSDVTLQLDAAYNLEAGYDFGKIELSTDGGTSWKLVDKFTGTGAWATHTYDLSTLLSGAQRFQLRFHLTADFSIQKDGLKVDDVKLFTPEI